MYCLDTDVLSALGWPQPPLRLVRRLSEVSAEDQCTTSINVGEMLYGVEKRGGRALRERVLRTITAAGSIVPFDRRAAKVYGPVRAQLEREGRRLAEPDLRIASIALVRDLTLVTGNVKHFARVPGLRVENWFE